MTKKHFLYLFLIVLFYSSQVFSNINSIDLEKIRYLEIIQKDLDFVIENQEIFNHWSKDWTYEVSKEESLARLVKIYDVSANRAQNVEEWLLTGMLAHFRYNLNDEDQFLVAESAFQKAIDLDTSNYKSYWFLGNHYAHSAKPTDAMINLFLAEKLNSNIKEVGFWHDYTFASYTASMFSHAKKGLDTSIFLGTPSPYDETIRNVLAEKLKIPDLEKEYKVTDLWDYQPRGTKRNFISRALGIRFSIDSTWSYNIYKFSKQTAAIMIQPTAEKNSKETAIDYTIMLMIRVANENEPLEDLVNKMVAKYTNKKTTNRFDDLNPSFAYEVFDKDMYPNIGGAHINFIALEKSKPNYPGLLLENAKELPNSTGDDSDSSLSIYSVTSNFNRFEEKIQYLIILDTCEDIYDKSLKAMVDFLKTLVIE